MLQAICYLIQTLYHLHITDVANKCHVVICNPYVQQCFLGQYVQTSVSMVFNSIQLKRSISDVCRGLPSVRILSIISQPVRLAYVYTSASGLVVTIWRHALSILLIHHCISIFPSSEKSLFVSKLSWQQLSLVILLSVVF